MSDQAELWNAIFEKAGVKLPKLDDWLDKYEETLAFSETAPVVDLGCGFGNNTLYLYKRGYEVISCDFSAEALKIIEGIIPKPRTMLFNMLDGLPFENDSMKLVIADLSLHYFTWQDTVGVVADIRRCLCKGGYLLCRVNSVRDENYGAGQGNRIEENYYELDGKFKRFFDKAQLEKLFDGWDTRYLEEYNMDRYKHKKIVWEIAVQKI